MHTMTAHGRMEVYIYAFFDFGSGWGERPPSRRGLSSVWEWAAGTLEAGPDPQIPFGLRGQGTNLVLPFGITALFVAL
jgi:hypothetical protein